MGIDDAAMSAKKNAPRWIQQRKAIGKWPAASAPAANAAIWFAAEYLRSGPAAFQMMLPGGRKCHVSTALGFHGHDCKRYHLGVYRFGGELRRAPGSCEIRLHDQYDSRRRSMLRVLIVDDEPMIRESLRVGLEAVGYEVSEADNAQSMFERLERLPKIDLMTLDLKLGNEDGLELALAARGRVNVPIIMITAFADPKDRVLGLEYGADDYIVKPYHIREVMLRIRLVIQRYQAAAGQQAGDPAKASNESSDMRYDFEFGVLHARQRTVVASNGNTINLTDAEFDILSLFVRHPGRVMTREDMTMLLKGRPWSPEDRTLDGHVARLRRKVEPCPADPQLIKTVWGVGYVFAGSVRQVTWAPLAAAVSARASSLRR